MAEAQLDGLVRHLRGLAAGHKSGSPTDGEFLHAFLTRNDPQAFEALVRRHGPLVLAVCRRVLGGGPDAEDAFQATFLLLARRAASIRKQTSLGSWLHGVAYRMASQSRRGAARRRAYEQQANPGQPADPASLAAWHEVQVILDEEIQALPAVYREPFVLCCLEHQSAAAAAERLAQKESTIYSRLTRARAILRRRLARRGVSLGAVAGALALVSDRGLAAVPRTLLGATVKGAAGLKTGPSVTAVSARVAALVVGGQQAIASGKSKLVLLVLLAAGVLGIGLCLAAPFGTAASEPREPPPGKSATDQEQASRQQAPPPALPDAEVEVTGRVLGPSGESICSAEVWIWTAGARPGGEAAARTRSDPGGEFRLTTRESVLARGARVIAREVDGAPDWVPVPDAGHAANLTLHLPHDDVPLTGRVLDLEGKPLASVTLEILSIGQPADGQLTRWIDTFVDTYSKGSWIGWRGLHTISPRALGLKDPVTDEQGRFRLTGVGRDRVVTLITRSDKAEAFEFQAVTRAGPKEGWIKGHLGLFPTGFDLVVGPTKLIEGTVHERGSGKPLAGVTVACVTQRTRAPSTVTDAAGRFRIVGAPKLPKYEISIGGRPGLPILDFTRFDVSDTAGLEPLRIDLEAERGVELTGRVLDRATGKPVRGEVSYHDLPDNPHLNEYTTFKGFKHLISDWGRIEPDGTFHVVGIPGPGLLVVLASDSAHYVLVDPWREMTARYKVDPISRTLNAVLPVRPSADDPKSLAVGDILLEPGRVLTGSILGSDGLPVAGAIVAGSNDEAGRTTRRLAGQSDGVELRSQKGPEFTARGLAPNSAAVLVVYHPEKKLARIERLRGSETSPLTVRLEPCGTVSGRVLDGAGKPLEGATVHVQLERGVEQALQLDLPVMELNTTGLLRCLNQKVRTDVQGRFAVEGLFPGLPYQAFVVLPGSDRVDHPVQKFSVPAGQTKELGDLRPQEVKP